MGHLTRLHRASGRLALGLGYGEHLALDLNLAMTVGGQAIRYTQCKTQPHADLSPLLHASLSTIHMYECELREED